MGKRKKKDPFSELSGVVLIFIFGASYFYTKSFSQSIFVFFFFSLILIGVSYAISFLRNEKIRRSGIGEIDRMDGREFEKRLSYLFQSQGYKVKFTPISGDFGADLILEKEKRKIVVQAKRYGKNVGIRAVQEVVAALKHYDAQESWVVTNRDFTEAAYKLASTNNVKLINRKKLIEMLLNQG